MKKIIALFVSLFVLIALCGSGAGPAFFGWYPNGAGSWVSTIAASKLIPGATSLSLRNNADSADNILISDAGLVTIRNGVTVTASNLTFGAASAKLIPGATSFLFRNTADSATNLGITDAGLFTYRGDNTFLNAADSGSIGIGAGTTVNQSGGSGAVLQLEGGTHTGGVAGFALLYGGAQSTGSVYIGITHASANINLQGTTGTFWSMNNSGQLTSKASFGNDIGWAPVAATAATCNATCSTGCVMGFTNVAGTAVTAVVSCATSITGTCMCAGAS